MVTDQGTTFKDGTPRPVVDILDRHIKHTSSVRLRIFYGDNETGRFWGDVSAGYIGRSMGAGKYPQRVPIMLPLRTSMGGEPILTDCVVRIEYANKKHGGTLYQHPAFHIPADLGDWYYETGRKGGN